MLKRTIFILFCTIPMIIAQNQVDISADGRVLSNPIVNLKTIVNKTTVPFGDQPDWQNNLRYQVGGLGLADINNDGRLDIVVGCYKSMSYPPYKDSRNFIHFNSENGLEQKPSWFSEDANSTGAIQIGDINKDGYLDVFSGNGLRTSSVIYFGSKDGLETKASWSSKEKRGAWTTNALLVDLDKDGWLELITTNQGFHKDDPYRPIHIFKNSQGTLEQIPSWASDDSIQNGISVGDIDGDGWLDIAIAKWFNFESCIYKNNNGTIEKKPMWTTGVSSSDKSIVCCDIDNDKQPDIVLGTAPTHLYNNDKSNFKVSWKSGAKSFGHSAVQVCDIDQDGDMDVAEIHFTGGLVNIYLNNNGQLDAIPSWQYNCDGSGTEIAFGDINGDNRPDLIVGNSGQPSIMVFYNKK
ncbi:FG-GAP repeat domain-containing protein [Candidatus Uabimicrobium sp. HlEnr_7]|uniref:FG-GAP repeat domain-containing protein n=1 Tax=Candidatus Uabimicrobium helgolandensis TaxID=3095367 RepID=UPI00355932CE